MTDGIHFQDNIARLQAFIVAGLPLATSVTAFDIVAKPKSLDYAREGWGEFEADTRQSAVDASVTAWRMAKTRALRFLQFADLDGKISKFTAAPYGHRRVGANFRIADNAQTRGSAIPWPLNSRMTSPAFIGAFSRASFGHGCTRPARFG